ncbi:MAG: AAA family ATPase [Bacteroidota bacterium]
MKKLPVGYQNLKEIIEDGFLYVDKTQRVYELIDNGKLYFLSRPRRFGKSLLISTLQHIFSGSKELFKDLYIGKSTNYNWQSYPILQFSFNRFGYQVTNLREAISRQLMEYADLYQIEIGSFSLTEQFSKLVEGIAAKGKPVVILIDEYDKPIVDFITEVEQAQKNQQVLKDLFSPLKELELKGHIRFLFITGVSKFSKVSLFSDLNNLVDLSISAQAHDLTGITEKELLAYFPDHIERAARAFQMSKAELLEGVALWYDGYSFEGHTKLYNPFSLLNFFSENVFGNFWFAKGTPTFLVKLIRNRAISPMDLEKVIVPSTFFTKFSLPELEINGLLFQTGYLTIKKVIQLKYEREYVLGYPNIEVRKSFMYNLLEVFTYQSASIVGTALIEMRIGLQKGNVEQFIKQLKILLSDLSYFHHPKKNKYPTPENLSKEFDKWEGYFHTIIYLVTAFLGLDVQSEVTKHKGRLDLIAQTDDFLYLMEFKLDEPAENAIQQIKDREYVTSYLNSPKTIILVGVGFSKATKSVEYWEQEIVEK